MLIMRRLLPAVLALALFALNNLAVLSGWLATPDGYVHLLKVDAADNAIYTSWLRSSQDRFLHPNFDAPWVTEPAVFQPLMVFIARLAPLVGLSLDWGFFLTQVVLYILGAYALFAAVRLFMPTSRQRWAALGVMLLAVPIPSLLVLPSLLLPLEKLGIPPMPGVGFFVWNTSDGFLHGMFGSILVTYGTAATIASFALLAAYMRTEKWSYLIGASATVFVCGLVHPYEPFLICAAGCIALVLWRGTNWRRSVPEVAMLGISGALGVAPLSYLALSTPWVRDAADITRWDPPNPAVLLVSLGVPAVVAVLLFWARRRMASPTDLLLQCWVACTLIGIYLPFIPWTQHFLDGFHYAVAMLVVRQIALTPFVARTWAQHRRLGTAAAAALVLLSLSAYPAYYWLSWKDGRSPTPERLFRSVIPAEDLATRDWLTENGAYSDLVLAPVPRATWFSTSPMHSFAGNRLFSITFEEQRTLSDDFFAGRMSAEQADRFLSDYGVRWVVLPSESPMRTALTRGKERVRFGSWTVLDFEGNKMKPYPGIPR